MAAAGALERRRRFAVERTRDDAGEGGLAHAWRTPEDHGWHLVGLDDAPQHLARPDKMLLTRDLVERLGPHARGERLRRSRLLLE